jgi:hypothetical protein
MWPSPPASQRSGPHGKRLGVEQDLAEEQSKVSTLQTNLNQTSSDYETLKQNYIKVRVR